MKLTLIIAAGALIYIVALGVFIMDQARMLLQLVA